MLRPLLCLLLAMATAQAAIEVVKVPGIEEMREPVNLAFDAQGGAYLVESMRGNRLFRWLDGRIDPVSGVRWDSAPKGMEPPAPAKALDLSLLVVRP